LSHVAPLSNRHLNYTAFVTNNQVLFMNFLKKKEQ
jgi:hypothetical protein